MDYKSNKKEYLKIRKTLRSNLTPAEATIWKYIKNKRICNAQWRRQFSIGKYILDFYCPAAKLAIELDGKHHFSIDGTNYDEIRTKDLQKYGITIIRFENKEMWENPDGVINAITEALNSKQ